MRPVRITCDRVGVIDPMRIAASILDVESWSTFEGWGPLPGIREATFIERTDAIVGSRISCINTDGSTHEETITHWDPPRAIGLSLHTFSRPLSRLATHFEESIRFAPPDDAGAIRITRTMDLFPTNGMTRPMLFATGVLLRRALRAHLAKMIEGESSG